MRNHKAPLAAAALSTLLLAGCGGSGPDGAATPGPQPPPDDKPVATVNGQPVSQALFEAFVEQRRRQAGGKLSQQQRDRIVKELIDLELLVQVAQEKGLHREPAVAGQLIAQYKSTLARALVQRRLDDMKVGDEALKKAYEDRVAAMGNTEYKASHILLDDKSKAQDLIDQLDRGADFAELARQHSTGPSASKGGDLGWFSPDQMVEPFSRAATALEPGSYTKEPVKTEHGWHVILLEDKRQREAPSMEEMRGDLTQTLRRQNIEDYLAELRKKAEIERK